MSNLKSVFFKVLCYFGAFLFGGVFFWVSDRSRAEIPNPANVVEQPIPVRLSNISIEDDWINGFNIGVVSLQKIDSNRRYLLLVMTKRIDLPIAQLPNRPTALTLKGFMDSNAEIHFSINPSQMENSLSLTYILLLDLGGQLLRRTPLLLTENLEISSTSGLGKP